MKGMIFMADYKEMYTILFHGVTKAISILQEAQLKTEEIYMSSEEAKIQILPKGNTDTKPVTYSKKKIKQKPLEID